MRKEVVVQQDPKSPISEIFRTLRTVLITSTFAGEGKSWISSNLAVTFAQAGKKVILLDADMRKGRQYSIFGVSPRPGLSNYLSGVGANENEEKTKELIDYIQETPVKNLYLMPAGNIPPNPSELLITPQMVDLLEQLKEICDIVIIDGTPSQLVTDSLILTRLVDSTLIVTASKQTKKEDLKRVIANIQNVGGKIAGVVVNKLTVSAKKYEQSYYYGSTNMNRVKTSNNRKRSNITYQKASHLVENKNDGVKNREVQNSKTIDNKIKDEEELPNALNKQKNEKSEEVLIDKTHDILKQINEYLDEEKKKLK